MPEKSGLKSAGRNTLSTAVTPAPLTGRETRQGLAPPRTATSRASPRSASQVPPRTASRAPPRTAASQGPPRTAASQGPPRTAASQGPPKTANQEMDYFSNHKRKDSFSTWSEKQEVATYEVYLSQASTYLYVQEYAKAIEHYSKVHESIYVEIRLRYHDKQWKIVFDEILTVKGYSGLFQLYDLQMNDYSFRFRCNFLLLDRFSKARR